MPLPVNLETAKASYHGFVTGLLANRPIIDPSQPLVAHVVHVPRWEVLGQFLTRNPEFQPFRSELSEMFSELENIPLDAEGWNQRPRA